MAQPSTENEEKYADIPTQEIPAEDGNAAVRSKKDSLWLSGTAQSAFISKTKLINSINVTKLDYQSLEENQRNEEWAMEVLAVAYSADISSAEFVSSFCDKCVECLTQGDKAYILETISPQEDKLLDLKRIKKYFPIGRILSIGDFVQCLLNMIDKAKEREGSVVGEWRSAKRIILTVKYNCLPAVTRKAIYNYLNSVDDAKNIKEEQYGQTAATLKNMFGYIGTKRFAVNTAWVNKWFRICKIGYGDKLSESFTSSMLGVTIDEDAILAKHQYNVHDATQKQMDFANEQIKAGKIKAPLVPNNDNQDIFDDINAPPTGTQQDPEQDQEDDEDDGSQAGDEEEEEDAEDEEEDDGN